MMNNRQYIRTIQLRALYEHSQGCECAGCRGQDFRSLQDFGNLALAADAEFSNQFKKIPGVLEQDFLKRLHGGKWKKNALDAPMWQQYYSRFHQFAEAGYGKKLTDPKDWLEFQLMEQLKQSASHFAGGKLATLTAELKTLRNLPLKDFMEQGGKVVKRQHRYLAVEARHAAGAAQSASAWAAFERRAYLYPNLRYVTAQDERVRDSHRLLNDVVYPVHHVFWDTHAPKNGWECRCLLVQTDEPTKNVPDGFDYTLPKGFANNPGKTGKILGDDHPYFNWDKPDLAAIKKGSEALRAEYEMTDVYKLAEKYVGTTHKLPAMTEAAKVDLDFISKTLAATSAEPAVRNDLLTYLHVMASQVALVSIEGSTYIYKVLVAGMEFKLTVTDGIFKLIQ
jgi:SPP1 gp7 family putative phage head morphogenesis protein